MGREEHCKQVSLVCVGSAHSVWATLGLPLLIACVLSRSTLLRLQVALQGNCLKWALGYVPFPGLSSSGSGSWASTKVQTWLGLPFVPSQVRAAQVTRCLVSTLSQVGSASYHLPSPSCTVSWVCSQSTVSGVPCVSFQELISDCDPLGRCQPSRIPGRRLATGSLLTVWWKMLSLGPRLPLAFWLWLSSACLFASGGGWAGL